MKHKIILGTMLFFVAACGENLENNTSETDINANTQELIDESELDHPTLLGHHEYDPEKMKDWPARTYRSDGYRPSAASEWIKVIYTQDGEFINTVLYWNVNNETPIVMELIESELIDDEITGWSGKVKSPDGFFDYEFGIIEDQFNLIFDDEGRMQTFYQELE
jgi:hypothetical protein